MEAAAAVLKVEELTSGASGRIIPVFRNIRQSVLSYDSFRRTFLLIYSFFVWILLVLPRRRRLSSAAASPPSSPTAAPPSVKRRNFVIRRDEEDTMRRRALAEAIEMVVDGVSGSQCTTFLFYGVRRNALFCRSWFPVSGEIKGILIIIHGLNEHSGRYAEFAKQLVSCEFGVYGMDWIGHGGSDGLHGYVPSLDHVVADTASFLEKVKLDNPGVPCFLFGHSTGGAVVLKAASYPHIEEMLEGIILTSPALRVKPAHPIVGAVAPLFSLVVPRFQFKGANKRGIPVSRDPAALFAKYSDPLVYTGPIRVRTGHEILRISSYLMRNFQSITVPFFVLHGTADRVTDPIASQDLYNIAPSKYKDIRLYEGFLHDLLFEPEREEIARDIIDWMEKRLSMLGHESYW
ncbi:alpha/beta-Hydrolases superfamily protein [Striga asiatica]|uniref:Alpha/beta-Hydrolases superfamily protein n=1 Tax=Striga asiatica TaxID=4170 RepID=A0A5A7PZ49_STRAF|nr:alpha/beta-Hydrolases superfamily protein [Striga asiatica]